jgi:hypothetical protein
MFMFMYIRDRAAKALGSDPGALQLHASPLNAYTTDMN